MNNQHRQNVIQIAFRSSAFLFLLVLGVWEISAAPGDLDFTFSGDGKLTDGVLSNLPDTAYGVAMQPDGKIVVAGGVGRALGVARYNPDGSLDTAFGTGGQVTIPGFANAVAIQPDGKIVVAGSTGNDFALARFNSNGSLDTSFDADGKVTTHLTSGGWQDWARSIAIHTDGKIVVAGFVDRYAILGRSIAVVRFNADGSLDTTFDLDGKVITAIGDPLPGSSENRSQAESVVIQPDGKIIVAGEAFDSTEFRYVFALVRYNLNGSLDSSFSSDGIADVVPGGACAVALQADGKIVAAGHSGKALALARYYSDGSLDPTFDSDGMLTTMIGSFSGAANSLAIQQDGKIVAGGYSTESPGSDLDFAVARYNPNGSLDSTFGTGGIVITSFEDIDNGYLPINSVAIQSDGKIIAAGGSSANAGAWIVTRYNVNGSLDPTFDSDGIVITDFLLFANNRLHEVAIQSDGKIVTAGGARGIFAIARYNSDGTRDLTFGGTGLVQELGLSPATALAVQADGKIVAASRHEEDDFVHHIALIRYNQDGSRDTSFDGDGVVVTPIGTDDTPQSLLIQPDGKIVAAGSTGTNFAVVRCNPNGSLDTSFDSDGIVTTSIGSDAVATSVAVQQNGKIVVAGPSTPVNGSDLDFVVARYNMDGSLDTSFDGDGIVTTNVISDDYAQAIAIQSDGKIVVAGCASGLYDFPCNVFALARYNTNGSLDTTFDSDGKVTTLLIDSFHEVYLTSVAIRSDGKILTAGYFHIGAHQGANNNDFALALYNVDGSLDNTFGGDDGKTTADFDNSNDYAYGMALDGKGRAVVGGESDGKFAIARFLLAPRSAPFDYDGDGRTDVSVFRPSTNEWHIMQSSGGIRVQGWGLAGDKMAPADFDGDGKTDIAVFRPSEGNWYVINSSNNTVTVAGWGLATDKLVPGDYNGDGKADFVVFRESEGRWYRRDTDGQVHFQDWGLPGDKPAPADFDADGRLDLTVFRPSEGRWYTIRSSDAAITATDWGVTGDIPVAADYSGDGKADFVVFRPSDLTWYRRHSDDNSLHFITWGLAGDIPAPGDFDGDGKTDLAVYRPSNGTWYVFGSQAGIYSQPFGLAADLPTPRAFLY